MSNRDDFSQKTIRHLARRAGTLCSNPGCNRPAFGPASDPEASTNVGVAAHITAASPGGQRFDPDMSSEERKSISNGIWLCQVCAKMIDDDPQRYTVSVLRHWKKQAEERARRAIQNPRIVSIGPDFADTLCCVYRQRESPPPPPRSATGYRKITFRPIQGPRDLVDVNVPLVWGMEEVQPGKLCLVNLVCQNQGSGVDRFVRMDLRFDRPAISRVYVPNELRVQPLYGARSGASVASFVAETLLPGEYQRIGVLAADGIPFEVTLWTERLGDSSNVFVFDVVFGPDVRKGKP